MNVKERYLAAYNHQPVDRVPVALSYYHAGFARKRLAHVAKAQDSIERSIQHQTHYGFDPHAYVRGTADWQLARPNAGEEPLEYAAASAEWRVTQIATPESTGATRTDYRIETPRGKLSCIRVQKPDDFGTIEELFIQQECDIELLCYRPHPRYIVNADLIRQDARTMGDCFKLVS